MRLNIAVGIILAYALPATSKTEDCNHSLVDENRKERFLKLVQEKLPGLRISAGKRIGRQKKSRALATGALKNKLPLTAECDLASKEADVGVLSCGVGMYCMASTKANLGGICVDGAMQMGRLLQSPPTNSTYRHKYADVCGKFVADFDEYCDCTGFEIETVTGTITCDFGNSYCFSDYGCDNTCFAVSYSYTKYGDSSPVYGYCMDFTSPLYQELFCSSYSKTSSDCTLTLDGTPCNSCQKVLLSNYREPSYVNETCVIFDCENVGLGSGTCEYVYTPSMTACLEYAMNSTTYTYAPTNTFAPTNTYATADAYHYDVCQVCGRAGMVVTNPDGIVSAPNQYDRTCLEVHTAGQAGAISPLECLFVQRVMDPCGCKAPNGSSSTPTPTFQGPPQSAEASNTPNPEQSPQMTDSPTITVSDSGVSGLFSSRGALLLIGFSMAMLGFLAN